MLKSIQIGSMVVVAALTLSACQSADENALPEALEDRAQARWDGFVERDFKAAWDYYSPSFREMMPRENFAADKEGRPLRWHAADVIGKDCSEDGSRCQITVEVTYQAIGAPNELSQIEVTKELQEQWIQLDGDWWYSAN